MHINGHLYPVNELNRPYPQGPALYSDVYAENSPKFKSPVTEIVISGNRIEKVYTASHGQKNIPKGGWIYVLPKDHQGLGASLNEGDAVSLEVVSSQLKNFEAQFFDKDWHSIDNVLASTPLLLYNGGIPEYLREANSAFYTKRHPRTAVGLLKNGAWVFVVVDGRQKCSEGATILELAQLMKNLGCVSALNFDGGGSSTMVIHDKIVNSLSGREYALTRKERPVSNALLICAK
jgi:hypothetical protein